MYSPCQLSGIDKSKKVDEFQHRRSIALFLVSCPHFNRMSQESQNPDLAENGEILSIKYHEKGMVVELSWNLMAHGEAR